jgi:hypothetical protein
MNQLDPELKRLIRWSRQAEAPLETAVPFGFATRVTGLSRAASLEAEPHWAHQLRWSVACLSLAVMAIGAVVWAGERRAAANNVYNFVPTFQLAAHNIAP